MLSIDLVLECVKLNEGMITFLNKPLKDHLVTVMSGNRHAEDAIRIRVHYVKAKTESG